MNTKAFFSDNLSVKAERKLMKKEKISKEKIIAAFLKVSFEKSASGTALSDIAEEVGIKKASLYNYYDNRDAIVCDVMGFCGGELKSLPLPPVSDVGDFSVSLFRVFDSQRNMEIFSLVDSEKLFNDDAFAAFEDFKIRLIKCLHLELKERSEMFVCALLFLLADYVSAKKMMARNGDDIEFSEKKIRAMIDSFMKNS